MVPDQWSRPITNDGQGWSTPHTHEILKKLWITEPDFSHIRLNEIRGETKMNDDFPKQFWDDGWVSHFIDSEGLGNVPFSKRGPVISNDIHPIFDLAKFNTPLPMNEVSEEMKPSLRLATNMITDSRALEWFFHVRHGPKGSSRSQHLRTFKDNPDSITKKALGLVKADLLRLANQLTFQWFGNAMVTKSFVDAKGVYTSSLKETKLDIERVEAFNPEDGFQAVRKGKKKNLQSASKAYDDSYHPTIWLSVRFFHDFLRHHNQPDYPARLKRIADFRFASVLVHELTHAWMGFCHPSARGIGSALYIGQEINSLLQSSPSLH